jgi:uncharacterized protein
VANRKTKRSGTRPRSRNPVQGSADPRPQPRPARPPAEEPLDHGQLTGAQGVLPPDGVAFPQILRGESYAIWRPIVGVIFGLSLFLLLTSVVSQAVIGISWSLTGGPAPYPDYYAEAYRFERPVGMLAVNLGIATLIPISWVLMAIVHQVRPHWLWSVEGRLRWRYFLVCLAIAAVAINAVVLLSTLVEAPPEWSAQAGFLGFLVVILLTSPLQAIAEEVFFRGYLLQALGSMVARPWFGVVVSALVFALLHGAQNLPLFLDRLGFGLLAAVLVWRTGGLEAAIAAHIINNVFAYVYAGLTTSIAEIRSISEIGWVDAAFDVGGFALFAGLAYLAARRLRVPNRVNLAAAQTV